MWLRHVRDHVVNVGQARFGLDDWSVACLVGRLVVGLGVGLVLVWVQSCLLLLLLLPLPCVWSPLVFQLRAVNMPRLERRLLINIACVAFRYLAIFKLFLRFSLTEIK